MALDRWLAQNQQIIDSNQRKYQKIITAAAFAIGNIAKSSSNIYLPDRLTPDTKATCCSELYNHLGMLK